MGGSATKGFDAAIKAATDDEIKSALEGLAPDAREKIMKAAGFPPPRKKSLKTRKSALLHVSFSAEVSFVPVSTAVRLSEAVSKPEGRAALKDLFDKCDRTGEGKVDIIEWGKAVAADGDVLAKYFDGDADLDFLAAFKTIDKDGSHTVSWAEFESSLGAHDTATKVSGAMSTSAGKDDLKALFDKCDKTSDGRVNVIEWGKVIVAHEEILDKYFGGNTDLDFLGAFKRMDDKTGKRGSESLSWEEFEKYASVFNTASKITTAMSTEEGRTRLKELFTQCDTSGDGQVNIMEWGKCVVDNDEVLARVFGGTEDMDFAAFFDRMDKDGSHQVSWDEFEAAAAAGP